MAGSKLPQSVVVTEGEVVSQDDRSNKSMVQPNEKAGEIQGRREDELKLKTCFSKSCEN